MILTIAFPGEVWYNSQRKFYGIREVVFLPQTMGEPADAKRKK